MKLSLQPITFSEAVEYIRMHHRHNAPPVSWKFGVAVNDGARIVGVGTAGRPVARHQDDGWTIEINRVCVESAKNACSMLYGALCRASFALGYRRVITYTLARESGSSLRGAGFHVVAGTPGRSWNNPSRPRIDKHTLGQRFLWEKGASTVRRWRDTTAKEASIAKEATETRISEI